MHSVSQSAKFQHQDAKLDFVRAYSSEILYSFQPLLKNWYGTLVVAQTQAVNVSHVRITWFLNCSFYLTFFFSLFFFDFLLILSTDHWKCPWEALEIFRLGCHSARRTSLSASQIIVPHPVWFSKCSHSRFGNKHKYWLLLARTKINNRVIPKILRPTQMLNLVFEILAFQRILAFMEEMFVFFVLPMLPTSLSTHFS
jgi:hypothetical protein